MVRTCASGQPRRVAARAMLWAVVAMLVGGSSATAADYSYSVPVQASSPWPSMRHDSRNTGVSPIAARYSGDRPWAYRTGKGIFSTPIIGGDGTVYVGSADTYFYALKPDGTLRWRLKTGNIIDSAGVIGRYDPIAHTSPLTFGSADQNLYHLSTTAPRRADCNGRRGHQRCSHSTHGGTHHPPILWKFRPTLPPAPGQLVDWWEGNATIGPGGTIYAGNTGGAEYALTPAGKLKWAYQAGNSIWTNPSFAPDGTAYVGSLDAFVYALSSSGQRVWRTPTLNFVISSPALGSDGTVYIGSFDSKLYALDPATGVPKWSFSTNDHVYSSPAVRDDASGHTTEIYIASTDGSVYALSPSGQLNWKYDTGDVIRSSPVLGRGPGGHGEILYVGNGAGTLFALDADTGARRWSYNTTSTDPVLRDRNDLNSSPALGTRGIYIGSEDGSIEYVPYDYCLHRRDPRCDTNPGEPFGSDLTRVLPVTAGGSTEPSGSLPYPVSPAATIVGRLLVRHGGATENAAIVPAPSPAGATSGQPTSAASLVHPSPPFDFNAQISGDGRYIFITPNGFLHPDTSYSIRISGGYTVGGARVGNTTVGGTGGGAFGDTIRLHTAAARKRLPLAITPKRVGAFQLSRLAIPLPAFIPSVNQIGFDSYNLLVGTVAKSPPDRNGQGSIILWVVGARPGPHDAARADPSGNFAFPLAGRYEGDHLLLSDSNLTLTFSFGTVPLQRLDFRFELPPSLTARPGASLYGEVVCANVPNYGPFLFISGLCNANGELIASGTFITAPYGVRGRANRRPRGVRVASMTLSRPTQTSDGSAVAHFSVSRKSRYPARAHLVSILLTDAATGSVVSLDYRHQTTDRADRHGNLSSVALTIPKGTSLPARIRAYVITDVFPLHTQGF